MNLASVCIDDLFFFSALFESLSLHRTYHLLREIQDLSFISSLPPSFKACPKNTERASDSLLLIMVEVEKLSGGLLVVSLILYIYYQ